MTKSLIYSITALMCLAAVSGCNRLGPQVEDSQAGSLSTRLGFDRREELVQDVVLDCALSPYGRTERALHRKYCR